MKQNYSDNFRFQFKLMETLQDLSYKTFRSGKLFFAVVSSLFLKFDLTFPL
jgi:hypothetical protein